MMDASTQLNHWIALMAELEEAKAKIARAVYKEYKCGRVTDEYCLDCCRRMDDVYQGAKEYEAFLLEDFKPYTENEDAKNGKLAGKAKATTANFFSKLYIRHSVNLYKRNFREQYLDLGTRVIGAVEDGRVVCPAPQLMEWCKYSARVKKEAEMRWEEITILHREQAHGNAFLSSLKQFFTHFSRFARLRGGPWLKKVFHGNDQVVTQLREQYRKKMASGKAISAAG